MDESGTVLLTVAGLRLGGGASESERDNRLLNERLLTIEWEPRDPPQLSRSEPGSWLLLSTCDVTDPLTSQLCDALNTDGAQCTSVHLPLDPDGPAGGPGAEQLRSLLGGSGLSGSNGHGYHGSLKGLTGVVVVTAPPVDPDESRPDLSRARDYVSQVVDDRS